MSTVTDDAYWAQRTAEMDALCASIAAGHARRRQRADTRPQPAPVPAPMPRHWRAPKAAEERRQAAGHEAAHAVAAGGLGLAVSTVTIRADGSGETRNEMRGDVDDLVVLIAPEVWSDLSHSPWQDRGWCGDRDRMLRASVSTVTWQRAARQAAAVLRVHRAQMSLLTDALVRHGQIDLTGVPLERWADVLLDEDETVRRVQRAALMAQRRAR